MAGDLRQLVFDLTCAEINPASDYCQRWSSRRHSWRHRSEGGFDPSRYRVEPIDETTAKAYVVRHHYSGTYPAAVKRYGLFVDDGSDDPLVGVAVFGVPMSTRVLTNVFPGLEPFKESLELSRFVLEGERHGTAGRAPGNAESWFLARTCEELAGGGVVGVVAFSDPVPRKVDGVVVHPGHCGAIYQASNAIALGRATPRILTLLPDGKVLSERSQQKIRSQDRGHEHVERLIVGYGAPARRAAQNPAVWLADALETIGATRLRHRGNWRYAIPTVRGKARRQLKIVGVRSSYPKTADSAA